VSLPVAFVPVQQLQGFARQEQHAVTVAAEGRLDGLHVLPPRSPQVVPQQRADGFAPQLHRPRQRRLFVLPRVTGASRTRLGQRRRPRLRGRLVLPPLQFARLLQEIENLPAAFR